MKTAFILIGIGVLFVALTVAFQAGRPALPPSPANNVVAVRPFHTAEKTMGSATSPGALATNPPPAPAREVVVTRVILVTTPPETRDWAPDQEQERAGPTGVARVAVLLATITPDPWQASLTPTPDPRSPAGMATRTAQRAQGITPQEQGLSPLPTPLSPLPTPDRPTLPMPSSADQAAAYALIQAIVDAETAHHSQTGRYAQLLLDAQATCPPGEACIGLGYPSGISAGVDVYMAPDGRGYVISVIVGGWRLTVAAGPEATMRSEGWSYE